MDGETVGIGPGTGEEGREGRVGVQQGGGAVQHYETRPHPHKADPAKAYRPSAEELAGTYRGGLFLFNRPLAEALNETGARRLLSIMPKMAAEVEDIREWRRGDRSTLRVSKAEFASR